VRAVRRAVPELMDVHFVNPSDPNAKPYAVKTMVVHGPRGSIVDTSVPPQCRATDAEIYVEGPAACAADSQIGSGFAESDQGDSDGLTQSVMSHSPCQG
jgi:hypothetical protein